MLVTTHSMVAIALTITTGNPAIYIPAAVVNHPVLDFLPHFGFPKEKYPVLRKKMLWPMTIMDAIVGTSMFFWVLNHTGLSFWLLFPICLLAGWPDLAGLYRTVFKHNFSPKFHQIHENIQHESPWYFWIDLTIIALCAWLIFTA